MSNQNDYGFEIPGNYDNNPNNSDGFDDDKEGSYKRLLGDKEITWFWLMQHYSKENAAAYKRQKEAKKNGKKKTGSTENGSNSAKQMTSQNNAMQQGLNQNQAGFGQNQAGFGQNQAGFGQNQAGFGQNQAGFGQNQAGFGQNQAGFGQNQAGFGQNQAGFGQNQAGFGQSQAGFGQNQTGFNQVQQSFLHQDNYNDDNFGNTIVLDGKMNMFVDSDNQQNGAVQQGYSQNQQDNSQFRQGFGQAQQGFGQMQQSFSQPQQSFGQAQQGFGQMQQGFSQPQQSFGQAQQDFGQMQQGFSQPQQSFGQTQQAFFQPQQSFGQAQQGFSQMQQAAFQPQQKEVGQDEEEYQETSIVGDDYVGTSLLEPSSSYASITRVSDGTTITLNKMPFVLGRKPKVADYLFTDNTNVSGKHATIGNQEGIYYIEDTNSRNGVFLNGFKIEPGEKIQLVEGMEIMLGDEKLIFHE